MIGEGPTGETPLGLEWITPSILPGGHRSGPSGRTDPVRARGTGTDPVGPRGAGTDPVVAQRGREGLARTGGHG